MLAAYQRYCVTHDLYAPRASCASQCSSMLAGITEDCKNPNSDGFCGPCTQNGLTDFRICANCDANYIGAYGGTTLTQALNSTSSGLMSPLHWATGTLPQDLTPP